MSHGLLFPPERNCSQRNIFIKERVTFFLLLPDISAPAFQGYLLCALFPKGDLWAFCLFLFTCFDFSSYLSLETGQMH